MELATPAGVLAHLRALAARRPVFSKDTLEYRYAHLYEHPDELADFHHVFIVRDPAKAIASHFAMKPTVSCAEIGYEHQSELFDLFAPRRGAAADRDLGRAAGRGPGGGGVRVLRRVGLPYRPGRCSWQPQDRAEWRLTAKWHVDAGASSGFRAPEKQYAGHGREQRARCAPTTRTTGPSTSTCSSTPSD